MVYLLLIIPIVLILILALRKNPNLSLAELLDKKLREELAITIFRNDWERRQIIGFELLWIETVREVSIDLYKGIKDKKTIISSLTAEDIKLPDKWELNSLFILPTCQKIIDACRKVFANNEYKGAYKPESILPFPKKIIRKAILYMLDYKDNKEAFYSIELDEATKNNLEEIKAYLEVWYLPVNQLPKDVLNNMWQGLYHSDMQTKMYPPNNCSGLLNLKDVDLHLIDWYDIKDWLEEAERYTKENCFDFAFICYEKAKEMEANNEEIVTGLRLAYYLNAKYCEKRNDNVSMLYYLKESAELGYQPAISMLKDIVDIPS
jgi:hypothetical protein